jgi:hypothetical protein
MYLPALVRFIYEEGFRFDDKALIAGWCSSVSGLRPEVVPCDGARANRLCAFVERGINALHPAYDGSRPVKKRENDNVRRLTGLLKDRNLKGCGYHSTEVLHLHA